MPDEKTVDQIAEDAAKAVKAEAEAEAGKASAAAADDDAGKDDGGGKGGEDDFTDDDLDPDKIEAGIKAKTLNIDQAGLLKRLRKVREDKKSLHEWRSKHEPKIPEYEAREKAVTALMKGITKLRSKDKPEEVGFLEELLDDLMDESKTPNWAKAKAGIEAILGIKAGEGGNGEEEETPKERALRERIEKIEREKVEEKRSAEGREAQRILNVRVAKAFVEIPKELSKKPEFKGLPWKDKEFKEEFEGFVEGKLRVWLSENEEKVNKGEFPPITELAEKVAKIYLRGGSDTLARQVKGGDREKLALNRGDGPGGTQTRKLPDNPKDEEAMDAYLKKVAGEVVSELG